MWTVFFVSKDDGEHEIVEAQVLVSDASGEITEVRTGPQVAWSMARGYEGAFGRAVSRPAIWLPLSALFLLALLPVMRPRRLLSMRTLDLLVLLSFGVLPDLVQPGRDLHVGPAAVPADGLPVPAPRVDRGVSGTRRAPAEGGRPRSPRRRRAGGRRSAARRPTWLLVSLLAVALALRFGLNAFDSNVIDVGYAGVIGADRITHGETPYGTFPSDCATCDTYGPLNYIAYVPFELDPAVARVVGLPPRRARRRHPLRPALHRRACAMLGWQLSGLRLGIGLALAWAAFPFTAYALESNSNDSLVAAMLIWGLVAGATSARARPAAGARAGHQVRAGGPDTALEPPAVSARGLVAPG